MVTYKGIPLDTPLGGAGSSAGIFWPQPRNVLTGHVAFPCGRPGTPQPDRIRTTWKLPNVSALVNVNHPWRPSAYYMWVWILFLQFVQADTPPRSYLTCFSAAPPSIIVLSSLQTTTGATPYGWMLPSNSPNKIRQISPSRRVQTPLIPLCSPPPTCPSVRPLCQQLHWISEDILVTVFPYQSQFPENIPTVKSWNIAGSKNKIGSMGTL